MRTWAKKHSETVKISFGMLVGLFSFVSDVLQPLGNWAQGVLLVSITGFAIFGVIYFMIPKRRNNLIYPIGVSFVAF
ncbi:MAG TPA: hypothetical protein VJ985_01810, partial [Gammaproteobacteria bacterium]|nr:hypothetical protein [Gammaproteobacteria bacterium]